ncbi:MAG: PH domain-containing protein [Oscillospiraceae bacterium]|nr:PH domain-containing protein [Oscillospiraceae bacterium]
MRRQHPAALLGYTTKNFWLLLIPLVRGLWALRFDLYTWTKGAGWDILAVTAMIAIAAVRWYFTFYEIDESGISVKKGMIFRSETNIPCLNVSAVTSEENPVLVRLGAVKVYIDTDSASGGKTSADLSLMMYKSDRARLFNILSKVFRSPVNKGDKKAKNEGMSFTYKASSKSLIAFSLLFSSALSGVVLLMTALSGSTDIIGDRLEKDFFKAVNDVSDAVSTLAGRLISGISPAGIAISVIIGLGFVISFAANVLRHLNFTVSRRGKCIIITGGMIVRRMYCINSRKINISDMRQNLLMKLFGVTSVHVNCTGYGKRKNELPVFVPICSVRAAGSGGVKGLDSVMDRLLPGFSRSETYINPRLSYIMRFIGPPAVLIFAVQLAGLGALMVFPNWRELITFMTVLCEIPSVWLLFAKACAYCTNGINITSDSICAKYCNIYDFHTVTVPLERVSQIRITQTIFQRMNKSCDVHIFTSSEHIGSHRVRSLPIREVQELIRERF